MIRHLTHKLRSQTLNESESFHSKPHADDERDSGTESDDEGAEAEELQKFMENVQMEGRKRKLRTGRSPRALMGEQVDTSREVQQQLLCASKTDMDSPLPEPALDSALPSDSDHNFDHHSSEEELEVINCGGNVITRNNIYPEKRKWSQANRFSGGENSASSDDELRDVVCISTPVEFCASPPANVHKPSRSLSPPPKVFHSASANIPSFEVCSVSPRNLSPRKKHRHMHASGGGGGANIQRPCLDFEKMQQRLATRTLLFVLHHLVAIVTRREA
ncbi:uncharacterized protein LOC106459034 isoform X2 [Limulus polyphemus]|uniref:Uncharacterized protein LOC106459034 isoform X2 n=1 Tax=Limulus polyphemus TaxID=6850 RepID=A0ABM1SBW2_LIMPO|nr:uncharacterized protein LOC106459034 isoform X2 [Limulus polyphemus]